jgi:hypothetical protein
MEMQGLKPSILMGKPKQRLPPGVSTDNDLFLSMFLIRLPPSMREAPETTRRLWRWLEPRMPCRMLEVATTPRSQPPQPECSRSPAPTSGKKTKIGTAMPVPKVVLLPALTSSPFKTRAMACESFTTSTATHTSAFSPVPGRKTKALPYPYRFGGKFSTGHCHSHAFPSKCRPRFSNG